MGQRFGDPANPLLLSVRSGAAASMPGMMDTVLNLGLNDEVVAGLAARHGQRFAYDCHRRLLQVSTNCTSDLCVQRACARARRPIKIMCVRAQTACVHG